MAQLLLPSASRARIGRHAERAYPEECCGILVGRRAEGPVRIEEVVATDNAATRERTRRYLIPPEALLEAHRRARRTEREVVGYYHSHPDRAARPSEHDLEQAWPRASYLIVAVEAGRVAEIRSWRMNETGDGFVEEPPICPPPGEPCRLLLRDDRQKTRAGP
ncbi:MAG: M67 family metallopeptidase [bacterium]|nr:M67 family metallopeptidase [bacterium]